MYYYALSVSYPTDLISVFVFFEPLFGLVMLLKLLKLLLDESNYSLTDLAQ